MDLPIFYDVIYDEIYDDILCDVMVIRYHADGDELPTRKALSDAIFVNKTYVDYKQFIIAINDYHSKVHDFVAKSTTNHFNVYSGLKFIPIK